MVKTKPGLGGRRFRAVKPTLVTVPQSTARLSRSNASSLVLKGCCLVCFRIACPLQSHRQYAQSRGLKEAASVTHNRQSPADLTSSPREASIEGYETVLPGLVEVGAANVDPFIQFPLPKGIKVEVHQLFQDFFTLHQTKSTTGPKAGPSPLTPLMREILSSCSESAALCQSIVAASAVWHASYRGHLQPDTRILSLHGQAIQTFRKLLSNSTTTYSNATILAAACLTHQQVLCRNRSGLKAHVDGIRTLVDARGGLHNVGWVAHIILWIDYYTCLYVDQEPRFDWPMNNDIRLGTIPIQSYGSAFESLQLENLLDPALRQLCIEVCRIVELLESTTGKRSSKSVQYYYRYKRAWMSVQLGHLHARFHGQGTVNECVSLTLNILVLKIFFMHVLDESRIDLCSKLRIALELVEIKSLQYEHMNLLTWILFTASAVAPNTSQWKSWFINRLKPALAEHFDGDTTLSFPETYLRAYLVKVLQNYAWSDKLLTHVFEKTFALLTPGIKQTLPDEKKTAYASGLFPG